MSSIEKQPEISDADFLDLTKENLHQWIVLREVDPIYGKMGFDSAVVNLWRSSRLPKARFYRRLFDALRVLCNYSSDEKVAEAFRIPEAEQPHDDTEANADIESKREQSRRLMEEADSTERQRRSRADRIGELRGKVPFFQSQVEYFERVLPGEIQIEIERCRAGILQNAYTTSDYDTVGSRARYIISMETQILAAERSLAEHPARLKKVQGELGAAKAELTNLEREHRKTKKRKTE